MMLMDQPCVFKELLLHVSIFWFVLMFPKEGKPREPANPIERGGGGWQGGGKPRGIVGRRGGREKSRR